MLIGLTGFAQSGKDTVASVLVEQHGFKRVAFADKIREFAYEANPLVACSPSGYLQDLVNLIGWDEAKKDAQVRRVLQNFGVGARKVFNEDFWVNQALSGVYPSENVVITDVRFINEAARISSYPKSQTWRVVRPDVGPINNHVSETEMNDYQVDRIVVNAGSLKDLEDLIRNNLHDF